MRIEPPTSTASAADGTVGGRRCDPQPCDAGDGRRGPHGQLSDLPAGGGSSAPSPTRPTMRRDDEDRVMTVVEHLSELRRRIFISLVAVAVGSIIGFVVTPRCDRACSRRQGGSPSRSIFTSPGGAFFLQIKIALMVGIAPCVADRALRAVGLRVAWSDAQRATRRSGRGCRCRSCSWRSGVGVAYRHIALATGFLLGFAIPGLIDPLITS